MQRIAKKKSGQQIEHDIINVANNSIGDKVFYNGKEYRVIGASKPCSDSGEPKTDVFIRLRDESGHDEDIKISCKKNNAQFIENKMKTDTMKAYWGNNAQDIVRDKLKQSGLIEKIRDRQLVFPEGTKRIPDTLVVTQGYRLDITRGNGGELSTKIYDDDPEGIKRFLSGDLLSDDKRNARVTIGGKTERVDGAGVANTMYEDDDVPTDMQSILDKTSTIDDYANDIVKSGGMNLELKAVNYRADRDKSADGNRSLAVMIEYDVDDNGNVSPVLHYDKPGDYKANAAASKIRKVRDKLTARNTSKSTNSKAESKTKSKMKRTSSSFSSSDTLRSSSNSPKRSSTDVVVNKSKSRSTKESAGETKKSRQSSKAQSKKSRKSVSSKANRGTSGMTVPERRASRKRGRSSDGDIIEVDGYVRSDGTYVRGYTRRCGKRK